MKDLIEREIGKGVSRRTLANRVGVSLGTVQNILLGDTEIKNSTLEKFSRYFNAPAEHHVNVGPSASAPAKETSTDPLTIQVLIGRLDDQSELIKGLRADIEKIQSERKEVTTEYRDTAKELRDGIHELTVRANNHAVLLTEMTRDIKEAGRTGNIKLLEVVGGSGYCRPLPKAAAGVSFRGGRYGVSTARR